MRLRRVCDEILASTGVRAGERHPNGSALVTMPVHLVPYGVSRSTVSIVPWIAILSNKVRNHPMESGVAIVSRACKRKEIPFCDWSSSSVVRLTDGSAHGL